MRVTREKLISIHKILLIEDCWLLTSLRATSGGGGGTDGVGMIFGAVCIASIPPSAPPGTKC